MNQLARTLVAAACTWTLATPLLHAQSPLVDAEERKAAIDAVAREIEGGYVFADVGRSMAEEIRTRAARGEYDGIGEGETLARLLTEHLRSISNDLHVVVRFFPDPPPMPAPGMEGSETEMRERFHADLARDNYGFRRVEILPGNIGYVRFDLFAPPELAAETYAAAMAFVAGTDALIIDLRENGGSISPDAIPMLATYFFESPTHLIDLKWNAEERPRQLWTWAHVPGERYLDKPLYILTSRRTFSGAEEFAYDLKNLKRATIVGDTTGGGANPGGTRMVAPRFEMFIPIGRVTSPVTGTNWEGVGVIPDLAVAPAKALLTAQGEALRTLAASAADPRVKGMLDAAQAEVAGTLARFREVTFELAGRAEASQVFIAGDFNGWSPLATPLRREDGRWRVSLELEPGRHPYKYIVDGEWTTDPANPETERDGPNVNSVRIVQ